MHDTSPNVLLPKNGDWVDVYTTLGVAVGTHLIIQALSAASVRFTIKETEPTEEDGYELLVKGEKLDVDLGSSGLWVSAPSGGAINAKHIIENGMLKDAWGVPKVTQDFSLFHGMFTYDVPPTMWVLEEDGTEIQSDTSTRATSVNGRLNLRSGTTPGNTTELESKRHPRYQPDRGLKWAASVGFKGANNDGILRAGYIVRDENGAFFKTKGDGKLYACVLNNSVLTHEEEIVFDFPIDITLGNIYDIQMQWRGVGDIKFFAGNPLTRQLELVYTIPFLNILDEELSISNPALSLSFHAENVTEEVSMWCGCVDSTSEGGDVEQEQYGSFTGKNTVSSGAPILAVRSPHLINGGTNTRDASLVRVTIDTDKKVVVKLYATRDETAIVGGSWDTFRVGSFMERNETIASVDTAKMSEIATFRLPANGSLQRDNPARETIDFVIVHGDNLVLVCDSGAIAEIGGTIEWGEEV